MKNTLKIMNASNNPILHCVISLLLALSLSSTVNAQSELTVLTDVWPPYINEQGQPKGSAAKLIELLFEYENTNTDWHFLPYELSFHQVKNKTKLVSFPYFKTKARESLVLFSEPVFSVTSKVYYNRQFLTSETAKQAYKNKQRVGKVAGYSYGEAIDKDVMEAVAFASEKQALTALFNHDIDVLPMTEGVMNHHLTTNFPQRKELILSINNISDTSSLHVVAAITPEGQAVINKLNSALMSLKSLGMTSLQATNTAAPSRIDIAKLITSEGYPSIIGQSASTGNNIEYFTLPQGSKALIIKWSNKILEPSKTDRIYKNMMDLSKVVILNGPHVGKELFVRNMHIELL